MTRHFSEFNLLKSRYELVQVVWLPAPGANDMERAAHRAARDVTLDKAYGQGGIGGRQPADDAEARDLVAGAPAGTGVVFDLRLKPAAK